jgi:hypothetical protein
MIDLIYTVAATWFAVCFGAYALWFAISEVM